MDRFSAMRAFVRVVEAGSFIRAAETLSLPRATVTRLIQGLEEELRVRLLQRTTRSVTVTAEGATYYDRVVSLLADLSDIETGTKQALSKPSGRVRVEVTTAIASMVVVPALGEFRQAYPDIQVELGSGNRNVDLVSENVDCAVRPGEVTEQSLVARRIGEFYFVTCASPAYLAQRGAPVTPDGIQAEHELVGMQSMSTARPLPFRFSKDEHHVEFSPVSHLVVNDTNSYLAAGVAGLGLIQAPTYSLHAALDEGKLVEVLRDWRTSPVPIHLIYPPNRFLSAKVRVFIDWMVSLFERNACLRLGNVAAHPQTTAST